MRRSLAKGQVLGANGLFPNQRHQRNQWQKRSFAFPIPLRPLRPLRFRSSVLSSVLFCPLVFH